MYVQTQYHSYSQVNQKYLQNYLYKITSRAISNKLDSHTKPTNMFFIEQTKIFMDLYRLN